ncbi:MAG: hypothetical protein U0P45_11160 [Acidimicrobiales bacterium]
MICVHPMTPYYEDRLFEEVARGAVPWHWGGESRHPEGFRRTLWQGCEEAFVPIDRATGRGLGIIRVYGVNLVHGFASMSIFLDDGPRAPGAAAEALWLVASHLFRDRGLRKVYGDLTSSTIEHVASAVGRWLEIEGRLVDHTRNGDGFEDKVIVAIDRRRWERLDGRVNPH